MRKTSRTKARWALLLAGLCWCGLATSCNDDDSPVDPQPPASLSELFGETLFTADKTPVQVEDIKANEVIGIYFSAEWCPACATFTPLLVEFHEETVQLGRSFQVVLVSSDNSSAEMYSHMKQYNIPWLAVPHGSSEANGLLSRYGVSAIPTLVIIDNAGNTISMDARRSIIEDGVAAYEEWIGQ